MSKYILGVDGGGTKTDAAVATLDGTIMGLASGSGANWESVGISQATNVLIEVINQACAQAGIIPAALAASTLAIAGIDWPDDVAKYLPVVDSLGLKSPELVNDSFAALAAGSPSGHGIISIAGTGGKTAGIWNDRREQSMGMELGEGGGAGQLVSEALYYMASDFHGSAAPSKLTQLVAAKLGFSSLIDFFEGVARKGLRLDTSLAPLIFEYAALGDPGALHAVRVTAEQHGRDVIGMAAKLGCENCVVVRAGGLHTAGSAEFDAVFLDVVKTALPHVEIKTLTQPPVVGAISLSISRLKGGE